MHLEDRTVISTTANKLDPSKAGVGYIIRVTKHLLALSLPLRYADERSIFDVTCFEQQRYCLFSAHSPETLENVGRVLPGKLPFG